MTPTQAKLLNYYRTQHDLDVCHFPVPLPAGKQYKFYICHKGAYPWNPTVRNGEGKIIAYLYTDYEEGLKEALRQAKLLVDKTT